MNNKFTFEDIKIPRNLDYESFRVELFKLLDIGKIEDSLHQLTLDYDKDKIYFQIKSK